MKRLLVLAFLGLGSVCLAQAQEPGAAGVDAGKSAAVDFSATSAANVTLVDAANSNTFSAASMPYSATSGFSSAPDTLMSSVAFPTPAAAPAPEPKFIFGGRDDYRWQLGLSASWIRFRSSIFNASTVGVLTSLTYYTNDWFAIEGNIDAGFAPTIFQNEHVKVLIYGAGPKIAWRQKRWEPWAHAIVGGSHEQPQTAAGGRNAFAVQAGGGVDYRYNPRLSFRLEGDYVYTKFFSQTQNNFQLAGGIVFHF